MKNFEIIKRNDSVFIHSTSYINPILELDDISVELSKMKYSGLVIFDLLLSNGDSRDRFVKTQFNGTEFDLNYFKITVVSKKIKKEIESFYYENAKYFKNSILSDLKIESYV